MKRTPWTDDEDERLKYYHRQGLTYEEIAYKLDRSDPSISRRIQCLKLKRNIHRLKHRTATTTTSKLKRIRPDAVYTHYGQPTTWAEHKDGCRYPVEPTNQPCNAPCKGVYCEAHSILCGVKFNG